ncbi:DUF4268 domain-containing protein [Desulfovibrio subterraneus]|uniref:DUF4268 domain-containing protein n=1 Tax=Desulfovibrio subterraneus TaxID=2718620 RepID=A0A7J0BLD4_9BACT|nr:DUF4268 domain-containing protein [Desulfovibrio subterraneus]GFM34553.1 hypothetical protein DSM101010T_29180 [Desulfovibrio subterraneus]
MFRVNRASNRMEPLKETSFQELGCTERANLQEWLENAPAAFGEDLLIIQKEFDGFSDTRERLDLLALDKQGNLVIIENKLDDSGRDVVWQALKYASYCSTLTASQIVGIYQQYIDSFDSGYSAEELICSFLGLDDLEDGEINKGKQQRIFLVAARFRKEVTSTVLWLMSYGVSLQCYKATPYVDGDSMFLKFDLIIPVPETKEMIISMSVKDAEEKIAQSSLATRHVIRKDFWEALLSRMSDAGYARFQNISPSKTNWICAGSGVRGVPYVLVFGKKEVRVEITPDTGDGVLNKFIYDALLSGRAEIEKVFGESLSWERLDGKKMSRIKCSLACDGYNRNNWESLMDWMLDRAQRMEKAFDAPLKKAQKAFRAKEIVQGEPSQK